MVERATVSLLGWGVDSLSISEGPMELRVELVTVPVSDLERAKAFYAEQVGFSVE